MDKIETRHGSKLKPMIRHIIGKQSRMTLKSVADSMRGHNAEENHENTVENSRKRSSTSSSQVDENTSVSSQGSEFSPISSGRSIPRTPLVEILDQASPKISKMENSIPTGNSIPRSPIMDTEDEFEKSVMNKSAESEVDSKFEDIVEESFREPIPKGNSIPRTPLLVDSENNVQVPEIVEKNPAQNMIPSGRNIPRTPRKSEEEEEENEINETSGFQEKLQ